MDGQWFIFQLDLTEGVKSIELRDVKGEPYYWINDVKLFDAHNGNQWYHSSNPKY